MSYSHKQIVQATGVQPATLLQWVERGIVVPDNPHPGRGQSRRWTFRDAVLVRTLVHLTTMGLTARIASGLADMVAAEADRVHVLSDPNVRAVGYEYLDEPIHFWRGADGVWNSTAQLGIPAPPELPAIVIVPSRVARQVQQKLEDTKE